MFPAKLLLFGEYSLMHGSKALAVPLSQHKGKWSENYALYPTVNESLLGLANYLEKKRKDLPIHTARFKKEISTGLYFDSDIPMGYGIGSSGALCAAIYSRYAINPINPDSDNIELSALRTQLALLESYFHGTSSGIDPLISYTNTPLLIDKGGALKRIDKDIIKNEISLFLIDTGEVGNTGDNIKLFEGMLKNDYYVDSLKNEYIPLVDECIVSFVNKDVQQFFRLIAKLSFHQQVFFEPMIKASFLKYFQMASERSDFALKLCGSGGGGFLLGFTSDIEQTSRFFSSEGIALITLNFE